MIINHPSIPAPPGLSAIEQVVADLYFKSQAEEQRVNEFERLASESRSRRDSLNTTIASLKAEYGLLDKVSDEPETKVLPPEHTENQTRQQIIDLSIAGHLSRSWVKPDNIPWVDLVRNAIKVCNQPLSINEIAEQLGMDEAAKTKHFQTLSGVLANYRGSQHLVGIKTYQKTKTGGTFSQFFTGLPGFFMEFPADQLKPEYDNAFKEKLKNRRLFLSEKEAAHS